MIRPRWRKVMRDFWLNKTRTIIAAVAIAIGTFSVGAVLTAYAVSSREIDANFRGTRPPAVIVQVDGAGASDSLAQAVAQLPGVRAAEARGLVEGRVLAGPDQWRRLLLFVVDDFSRVRVSTFTRERGAWPPATGEILVERSAIPYLERTMGDTMVVQTPNGTRRELAVTGVVHDPGQSPGWVDGIGYGYITRATLAELGEAPVLNELRVAVDARVGAAEVSALGRNVVEIAKQRGLGALVLSADRGVHHPHADQMSSLLYLLQAFGVLALLLGGVLVGSIVATLLGQQTRQIGAMKALGARPLQIAAPYLGAVVFLASAALVVGIPLGALAGRAYAAFTAGVLNFNVTSDSIPSWVFLVQIISGLAVPVLATVLPLWRASRMTVRQAVDDHGVAQDPARSRWAEWMLRRVPSLGRPLVLSLRNAFRRRQRLLLTVGLLAVGGATFVAAFNVSASWNRTVEALFEARRYDVQALLARPYPRDTIEPIVSAVPGVASVESWNGGWAVRESADAKGDGFGLIVTGVPPATPMIHYPLIAGRWLKPDDTNALVVNHELLQDKRAKMRVGETVTLSMNGRPSEWKIVGAVREIGVRRRGQSVPGSAYASRAYVARLTGSEGMTHNVMITSRDRSQVALEALEQRLEHAFDQAGIGRLTVQPRTARRKELLDHLVVIQSFLVAMALLVATVGGLALAFAMSVNVMERTREIGVLRAIGARTRAVLRIVVAEGVILAVLSWIVAVVVALPLGVLIGDMAGRIFVHVPLEDTVAPGAIVGWLALVVAIGVVASAVPAWRATRCAVTTALQYE